MDNVSSKNMKVILVDAINTFILKGEGINLDMFKLLELYPNKKIILTNADDEEFKEFGLDNVPYEIFTLKHNPNKTNPDYYEKMLEHYSLSPSDVVYFEHNIDAVKSAENVGIKCFYYDSSKKDLQALKVFLDSAL
ncbi:MAG: hypothetical protein ACMXYG_04550 [Candidatus Woesearchaeota archaeon]